MTINPNYHIGQFGYFEFTTKPKKGDPAEYPVKGYYRIADMDKNNLLLTEDDPDDMQVIVQKNRITKFEEK